MNKKTYEERKSKGLCVYCGAIPETKGVACNKCKERNKQTRSKNKQYAQKAHICNRCFRNKVEVGLICYDCLEKAAEYREKNKDKIHETSKIYYKNTYDKLKKEKICTQCRKRKAKEGKTMCKVCLGKKIRYKERYGIGGISRSERPNYGLCYFCGKELNGEKNICIKCKERCIKNLPEENLKNENWARLNEVLYKN